MVRDLDDGTYEVHVTVMEMGVHSLSLHLGGADLPGSPFLLQCGPGAANLERSRLIAIFCGSRQLYPKMVLASSTPPTAVQGAASTLASAAAPIAAPAAETSLAGLLGDSCSLLRGAHQWGRRPERRCALHGALASIRTVRSRGQRGYLRQSTMMATTPTGAPMLTTARHCRQRAAALRHRLPPYEHQPSPPQPPNPSQPLHPPHRRSHLSPPVRPTTVKTLAPPRTHMMSPAARL